MKNLLHCSLILWPLFLAYPSSTGEQPSEEYAREVCWAFESITGEVLTGSSCSVYIEEMDFKNTWQAQVLEAMCNAALGKVIYGLDDLTSVNDCKEKVVEYFKKYEVAI